MAKATSSGKGNKFLNAFWELAAESAGSRCSAAKRIVQHSLEMQKREEGDSLCSDGEYALRRLVRGLSSSRDSARQGFSACLSYFLSCFPMVQSENVIQMIEENTKISSSMRGSEERDLMFGRLFGYLALIRSGRICGNNNAMIKSLSAFNELYQKKAWIREVVSESILFLLDNITLDTLSVDEAKSVVDIIKAVLNDVKDEEIADVPASMLVLLSGMQDFQIKVNKNCSDKVQSTFASLGLPVSPIFSTNNFEELGSTLLVACSGFPKIHRVWYSILFTIYGVTNERSLPSKRLDFLSSTQEELLRCLVSFIDNKLVAPGSSHEKRGVALRLMNELLRLTPCVLIPVVFTKTMVHSLVSIRSNKNHTLFSLAGEMLSDMVKSSVDDADGRLTIANTIVRHEGAMFDSKTNSTTIRELLSGLDYTMILSYVKTLSAEIGRTNGGDSDEDSDRAVSCVLALSAIVKNPRMSERGNLTAIILSIFIRLACFSSGDTPSCVWTDSTKSTKKGTKKSKKNSTDNVFVALGLRQNKDVINSMISSIQGIEEAGLSTPGDNEKLAQAARTALVALLADLGQSSVDHLNQSLSLLESDNQAKSRSNSFGSEEKSTSLLSLGLAMLLYLSQSLSLAEEDEDSGETLESLARVRTAVQSLLPPEQSPPADSSVGKTRIVQSLISFIGQACFHVMCSDELNMECLYTVAEVAPRLAHASYAKPSNNKNIEIMEDDNAEDDEDVDGHQASLFDACMDLLSVSDKHHVKGVRDATKRMWSNIVQFSLVENSVVESILSCVVGDDVDGDEENDQDGEGADHGDGADEDEESEEEKASTGKHESEDEDDEDEDDIELDESGTMRLLQGDDDEDHMNEEGMDAALANMIKLRKQNRKQGLLAAKRQDLIVRSRAIDILEVFIHRNENASILLPMFYPLLFCLKKVNSSSVSQSLQEGRAFENRLRSLVENKLCKAKFSIDAKSAEEVEAVVESTTDLLKLVAKCLRSASAPMRITANCCFLSLVRAVVSGNVDEARVVVASSFQTTAIEYFHKKNGRIPVKAVDDVFSRFPDFAVSSAAKSVISACSSASSLFLRTDAFRLLGGALRKSGTLSQASKDLLLESVDDMVASVSAAMTSEESMKAKRMKSILVFAKDLAQFIKSQEGEAISIRSGNLHSLIESLSLSASNGEASNKQSNIKAQVRDAFSSIPSSSVAPDGKSKTPKGKLKQLNKKKKSAASEDDDFIDYEKDMVRRVAQPVEDEAEKSGGKQVKKRKKTKK